MKRIMIIVSAVMAISLLQIPVLRGQDVKTEKKIKIIINDKDGEKVVIDTIVTGENSVKTITMDGGKMIIISDGENHMHGAEKHVTVTVTDDETGEKGTEQHVSGNVTVCTAKDGGEGEKVIVVKKTSGADSHSEENMHVFVTSDENDSSIEKTRFVVAKNGLVVTVEGEDEEKAKELMKIIEEHLGVNKAGEGQHEKTDSKKNKK